METNEENPIKIVVTRKDGTKKRMTAKDWDMAYRCIAKLKKNRYKKILAYGLTYKVKFKLRGDEDTAGE